MIRGFEMSKARLIWEAQRRDAESEIAFERRIRFDFAEDEREVLREVSLDSRVDLAGMASVFLREES